jgi:hypothetical protein
VLTKGEARHGPEGRRHHAAAPKGRAKPVADFGRDPLHIVTKGVADATDCLIGPDDGEERAWLHVGHERQKGLRVGWGVGVGEGITHVQPDAPIVAVPGQGGGIIPPPVAHDEIGEGD